MSTEALHSYLERVCNLLRVQARASGAARGLQPVQLEMLHYLGQCNRYSNTPQAVADYLGQTKGTVSQTLKVLEAKRLVRKVSDPHDKRVIRLKVTPAGRRLLAEVVPARFLRDTTAALSENQRERIKGGLQTLLRTAQRVKGLKTFAACGTCRYNRKGAGGYLCGLTGEPLAESDLDLICREHQYG